MRSLPNFTAVIFDMDGLMFDTERVAQLCWQQAAGEHGYDFPVEIYAGVVGLALPEVVRFMMQVFGNDFPFDEVYRRRRMLADIYITNQGIPIKPGLYELLEFLAHTSLLIGLASSSGCAVIHRNLKAAGIDAKRFHAIIGGDDVHRSKPAPDIFLAAAEQLQTLPCQCLVLEDSNVGIHGAHAAGMIPIMVPDMKPPTEATKRLTYKILPDLHTVREVLFARHEG